MTKQTQNPFFDTDFSKLFDMTKYADLTKMMDVSKFMDLSKMGDMTKCMGECKMPNIDVESMMSVQRKGLETIASTNQKTMESIQSYMTRQAELARQSFEANMSLVQEMMVAQTPEEKVNKQVQATKAAIEGCVSNLKELSEMLSSSHLQTMQAMSSAVCESMDSMQNILKK